MKKLFIYGIIIFSSILIVSACVVFIPIISKDHSNGAILNNGDTIVGDMEENLNEDKNYIIFNCGLTEYFVGEELNLLPYFQSLNLKEYDILIDCVDLIIVNNFIIKSTKSGEYTISIYYKLVDDEDSEYTYLSEFTLTFFDVSNEFDVTISNVSINEYGILIDYKDNLDKNCFNFVCNDITLREIVFENHTIKLLVELNAFSSKLSIEYSKSIASSKDYLLKEIELKQNYAKFFKVLNESMAQEECGVVNLYLTNDNENHDSFYYCNDFSILTGLKLENINYSLVSSSDSIMFQQLENNKFNVSANKVGNAKLQIVYLNEILFTINFEVLNVEISQVVWEDMSFNTKAGVEINISPSKVYPSFAIYDIIYKCEKDNVSITNDGRFVSDVVGNYIVTINVNNLSYEVLVVVEDNSITFVTFIDLYDLNGNKVENISVNVNETLYFTLVYPQNFSGNYISSLKCKSDEYLTDNMYLIEFIDATTISFKIYEKVDCVVQFCDISEEFYTDKINLKVV